MSAFDLSAYVAAAGAAKTWSVRGRVLKAVGQVVEVEGIDASVGSELEVETPEGRVRLEVLGFRGKVLVTAPLGGTAGIAPGARVSPGLRAASVPVGDALLGRILDAFGRPIDGGPVPVCTHRAPLYGAPPPPFGRQPIEHPFASGVRAVDGLLPLGRGQRVGLFAGAGVGKSTMLGMMCRNADVDVVIVGLVGERGREVGDFVRSAIGPEGLAKTIVIAATSDMPPLVRVRGAVVATAMAEHFRAQGKDVLLVMDSVTRYAMALREATLAAGEPPLTKGYTPTVFASLPALLERAGCGKPGEGAITALYTVLVEGDDMSDPIADAVKGILDGHIVLARPLADRGVFPAVDILRSISRIAPDIAPKEQLADVARIRELLAAHEEAADLLRIGAYVPGSDPRIDAARLALPKIDALVRQSPNEHVGRAEAVQAVRAIVGGIG